MSRRINSMLEGQYFDDSQEVFFSVCPFGLLKNATKIGAMLGGTRDVSSVCSPAAVEAEVAKRYGSCGR